MILDAFRLEGKRALVTGASAGIGAAIAVALAEAGAEVCCHGNTRSPEGTAARISALGRRAATVTADLSSPAGAAKAADGAIEALGGLDILVNNAGTIRRAPAVEYSLADWNLVMQVNLTSMFQLCQIAGRAMIAAGRGGKIVNIASVLSFQGGILVPAYSASKGGVALLTKALANEWAPHRISVNAIAPGYVRTTNTEALRNNPERSRQILDRIPAARWGEPEDIAGAALFLASAASDYVSGHLLTVDGGWLAR